MTRSIGLPLVLFSISFILSCGGSSTPPAPAPLIIQFSPAAPHLAVNSSIDINVQTTPPLNKYTSSLNWSIVGYASPSECVEVVPNPASAPMMPGCPNGWLAIEGGFPGPFIPPDAFYYSPAAPGNFTVSVQGQINDRMMPQKIDFQGTSSVVVSVIQ